MGICHTGIFYFYGDVVNGPPKGRCLSNIETTLGKKPLVIGILLLVSFFLTLLVVFTSSALCCKSKGKTLD